MHATALGGYPLVRCIPGFTTRNPVTGAVVNQLRSQPQTISNLKSGPESKRRRPLTVQLVGSGPSSRTTITKRCGTNYGVRQCGLILIQRGASKRFDWRPVEGSGCPARIRTSRRSIALPIGLNTAAGFPDAGQATAGAQRATDNVLNTKVAYDHAATGWGAWVGGYFYKATVTS